MIPVHELTTTANEPEEFEIIQLLPKNGPSPTVPHRHDYYELFIFENGGGTHLIDFRELNIFPCSAQLVAPGQVHHLKRSNESVGYALLFQESFINHHVENIKFVSKFAYMEMEAYSPVFGFNKEEFENIMQILYMINKECERKEQLNYEVIRQLLNIIILNCRRREKVNKSQLLPEGQQLYAEFRKQVDQRFRDYKKVKEYADLLNTTERQLNDSCKRRSGKSASTIIFERIIIEAKRLIVNTNMSVKEICFELNYEDPAHFSKFFKNQCNYSPSQFRELYTK